jgi:hypothetical protein
MLRTAQGVVNAFDHVLEDFCHIKGMQAALDVLVVECLHKLYVIVEIIFSQKYAKIDTPYYFLNVLLP